jgi:hypothetical protein
VEIEAPLDAPQPIIEAAPVVTEAPVAADPAGEAPAPRGRRRRLRSPYGFLANGHPDEGAAPQPAANDEGPASE